MKKILALLLAVSMIFVCFAACSSSDADKNNDDTAKDNSDVAEQTPAASSGNSYVIYSDNAFAPFEFLDTESGEYTGVDMDILAAVAEDQGFTYEMHNEGFDAAMGAVQAGQADAMIAGMTINDERKETFDFSDGYFEDGSILVVAQENTEITAEADLAGKVVAAKKGTVSTAYAESIKDEYGFSINYFEDSPTMYQAVINGNADACFEDFSVIGWAIKNDGLALQTVGDVVNPASYGFAVKKGTNAELIELFNAGLANLKESGKYEEILDKYGYGTEE